MREVYHALGLHMHQPPNNLRLLIETNEWEAKQIVLCYERALRYAQHYHEVARLNIGFSGILLEQLADPHIVDRYRHIIDFPQMLAGYREVNNIEWIGMGYFHPIFPLTPMEDWELQLLRGREKIEEVFGKAPRGFWPPEMAFCMEMIPALRRCGYEYVVVDSVHVNTSGGKSREDTIYQPHCARYEDYEITVIPRDRDISNAQESGMDESWFSNEVSHKTRYASSPCLVTTWSDGENGGWFRQTAEEAGFWGHYFAPFMNSVRSHHATITPVMISDYLKVYKPTDYVQVKTGAWNVGSTSGYDFSQWAGSEPQKKAMREVWDISTHYHQLQQQHHTVKKRHSAQVEFLLKQAEGWLLRAETSCYFFWGDAWISKVYENTKHARHFLAEAEQYYAETLLKQESQ
jgi:alpha-amylase/alpha-mannosidase (GH57 family)